jgi:hypothetical protein
MIVQPSDVGQDANWDGTSVDRHTNRVHPNLQSSMDWAEHQRIVCEARGLVTPNRPYLQGDSERERFITNGFFELQAAYLSRQVDLLVSKGIHQPNNPHIQVRTRNTNGRTPAYTFHLVLSAEPVAGLDGRFQWKGVQFTLMGAHTYSWPVNAMRAVRGRRTASISSSSPVLQRHLNALERARAAQEARELAEAERARAAIAAAAQQAAQSGEEYFDTVVLPAFREKWGLDRGAFDPNRPGYANFRKGSAQFMVRIRGTGYQVKYDKIGNEIKFMGAAPRE